MHTFFVTPQSEPMLNLSFFENILLAAIFFLLECLAKPKWCSQFSLGLISSHTASSMGFYLISFVVMKRMEMEAMKHGHVAL